MITQLRTAQILPASILVCTSVSHCSLLPCHLLCFTCCCPNSSLPTPAFIYPADLHRALPMLHASPPSFPCGHLYAPFLSFLKTEHFLKFPLHTDYTSFYIPALPPHLPESHPHHPLFFLLIMFPVSTGLE